MKSLAPPVGPDAFGCVNRSFETGFPLDTRLKSDRYLAAHVLPRSRMRPAVRRRLSPPEFFASSLRRRTFSRACLFWQSSHVGSHSSLIVPSFRGDVAVVG